jgi:hypothetical protein
MLIQKFIILARIEQGLYNYSCQRLKLVVKTK